MKVVLQLETIYLVKLQFESEVNKLNDNIFTGNYDECKSGNLISISGDRGRSVGFVGKSIPELAPKWNFWKVWHDNIGKIDEEENLKYYISEYYKQVLSKVNIEELLKDEINPILLCYEKGNQFCHRHILAEYIEMKYGVYVKDIKIDEKSNIVENERPAYIGPVLKKVIRHR